MRKLYQTEWHSIPFTSFARMRSDQLPDADFYHQFYKRFFEKYQSPSDLDDEWVRLKIGTVHQLMKSVPIKKSARILSIGCGLGLMEMELIKQGFSCIEVSEVSSEPLVWLKKCIPLDHIHIGLYTEPIPAGNRYDWILLSGVDYFSDKFALPRFLSAAAALLSEVGCCTLVCYPDEKRHSTLDNVKNLIRSQCPQLERIGVLKPAQFWAYSRTLDEFRITIIQAGLHIIHENKIDTQTRWPGYQLTFKRTASSS